MDRRSEQQNAMQNFALLRSTMGRYRGASTSSHLRSTTILKTTRPCFRLLGHTFLVEMASALAQKWKDVDKDATPESREESKQAIVSALSRLAKEYLITAPGAAIFASALAGLFPVNTPINDGPTLRSVRASDLKMSAVDWLWPNRFAIGELGLLVGLPDEGKGQILCDMAARVTRGSDWPLRGRASAERQSPLLDR